MNKALTVEDFISRFEAYAPKTYAVEGDPIGLHFGSLKQEIHKIMVTLDVRPEVVDEAIDEGVDFIFAHHPPIFKGPNVLTEDNKQQAMYAKIIRHGIAVYAAHTNLDAAPNGMNDWLAELYGLENTQVLSPHYQIKYYRVNVYIPKEDVDGLHQAIVDAGLASHGNYSGVNFQVIGHGHFTPDDQASPHIGQAGQAEEVEEILYSFICSEEEKEKALAVAKDNHPYEVPVIDVYALDNLNQTIGLGRVGDLAQAMPIEDYIALVKDRTGISGLRAVLTDSQAMVKRVAVLGGDGGKFYPDALKAGADTYITGDIYYHVGHDMLADGLNAIDPGHHFESICKDKLLAIFSQWQEEDQWPVTIIKSQLNTDPFTFY